MTTIKDHKAAKEEDKENLNPQTHTTFVPLLGDLHLDSPGMDGRALVEETSNVKIAENETSETTVASMKSRDKAMLDDDTAPKIFNFLQAFTRQNRHHQEHSQDAATTTGRGTGQVRAIDNMVETLQTSARSFVAYLTAKFPGVQRLLRDDDNAMVVAELHRVISEKESTIELLKDELEKFMDAHMSSSSSLRKAEGIVALFNDLTAKIDALQNEKDTLQEQIGEKNLQVAELEATILGCYIELSFAKENAQKLL